MSASKFAKERPEVKLCYACRKGDFKLPAGWTEDVRHFSGHNKADSRDKHKDQLMFSPACFERRMEQEGLFE